MSELRRLIIDTDTGSDDCWAIIEALRATDVVRVEAVTVVCGNFPLDLCVKNAMLAIESAGTYLPPVYRGMERPLLTAKIFQADYVHGSDGLGEMHLPHSDRPVETAFAPDAIIDLVMAHPGEIEIATIGPLTNIAMALLKEPRLAKNIKKLWILGGTAGAQGNLSPAVEYNVGTDPEAASIVLSAGIDAVWVTWDTARGDTEITPEDVEKLLESGTSAGRFCALCSRTLQQYYRRLYGKDSFGVVDSMLLTAALYPEVMEDVYAANCAVELQGGETRGYLRIDRYGRLKKEPNALICPRINAAAYKQRLFSLLRGE